MIWHNVLQHKIYNIYMGNGTISPQQYQKCETNTFEWIVCIQEQQD